MKQTYFMCTLLILGFFLVKIAAASVIEEKYFSCVTLFESFRILN